MKHFILIVFFIGFYSRSQHVFQKSFLTAYQDNISSMLNDNDSLLILGDTYSITDPDNKHIVLMKCDTNGVLAWDHFLAVNGKDLRSRTIAKGTDNYGISGSIYDNNINLSGDGLFICMDFYGNVQSAISFGGTDVEEIRKIVKDTDSTYIAFGASNSFVVGNTISSYGLKISTTGDTIWTRAYGGSEQDFANSICNTSDGMFMVTGSTTSFGSIYDFSAFIMKIDTDGNVIWHKSYRENNVDIFPRHILETSDGGFLISGRRENQSNQDAIIIKTDVYGELEWCTVIGGTGIQSLYEANETTNGDFVLTGEFNNPTVDSIGIGNIDVLLLKIDNSGNFVFGKIYGSDNYNGGEAIVTLNNGSHFLGGVTYNWNDTLSSYNMNMYLIKTDSNGVSGCNEMPVNITQWEPSITVSTNIVTSIATTSSLNSLTIQSGGFIQDSIFCNGYVGLKELEKGQKQLLRVVDLLGRETNDQPNQILIFVYSDGTVEKIFRMD